MTLEDDTKYELDKKQTILVNIPWLMFVGLFLYTLLTLTALTHQIEDAAIRLTYMIVLLYTIVRMFTSLGEPTLHFKERKILNDLLRCSDITLHNLSGSKDTDKCKWCGKTVFQIRGEWLKKKNESQKVIQDAKHRK